MKTGKLTQFVIAVLAMAVLSAPASADVSEWIKRLPLPDLPKIPDILPTPGRSNGDGANNRNPGNTENSGGVAELITAGMVQLRLSQASRDPEPTRHQRNLYSYADNYKVQGGFIGGIVGAVAGCVVAKDLMGSDCAKGVVYGAAVGGTVGYVAGSKIGERQEVYANQEKDLKGKLAVAQADLSDAKRARSSADRVVASHKVKLASLQQQYKRKRVTRDQYMEELGYATKDLEALSMSKKGLEKQVAAARSSLANAKASPGDQKQMEQVVEQLERENEAMGKALKTLSGVVETARV